MHKSVGFVLAVVLLLAGCVTNHFSGPAVPSRKPMETRWAWVTGLVPGLTQAINGEWGKAVLDFLGFMVLSSAAQPFGSDGAAVPGKEVPYNLLMGGAAAVWTWSYIDGLVTTSVRNNEYFAAVGLVNSGIRIGMSEADFLHLKGYNPDRVNTTTGTWGTHEQWVYPDGYYYFENGILTAWQY